jgi:hypothetical protein
MASGHLKKGMTHMSVHIRMVNAKTAIKERNFIKDKCAKWQQPMGESHLESARC